MVNNNWIYNQELVQKAKDKSKKLFPKGFNKLQLCAVGKRLHENKPIDLSLIELDLQSMQEKQQKEIGAEGETKKLIKGEVYVFENKTMSRQFIFIYHSDKKDGICQYYAGYMLEGDEQYLSFMRDKPCSGIGRTNSNNIRLAKNYEKKVLFEELEKYGLKWDEFRKELMGIENAVKKRNQELVEEYFHEAITALNEAINEVNKKFIDSDSVIKVAEIEKVKEEIKKLYY